MRPSLAFAGLLVPYVVIVAACIVVGAAFVAPDATFETVGSGGVVLAVVLGAASLLAAFRTDRALIDAIRRVDREHQQSRLADREE